MSEQLPCHMCGAEVEPRVLEYEVEPGQIEEIGQVCPDCIAGLIQMMHGKPPEDIGLEL